MAGSLFGTLLPWGLGAGVVYALLAPDANGNSALSGIMQGIGGSLGQGVKGGLTGGGATTPFQRPTPTTLAQQTNLFTVTDNSWVAVNVGTQRWHAHVEVIHRGLASDGGPFDVFLLGKWVGANFLGQIIGDSTFMTVASDQVFVGPDPDTTAYTLDLNGAAPSGMTSTPIARLIVQDLAGAQYDVHDTPTHFGTD